MTFVTHTVYNIKLNETPLVLKHDHFLGLNNITQSTFVWALHSMILNLYQDGNEPLGISPTRKIQ